MSPAPIDDLPVVIATSVIRSTHQGQSHGGVYLVDLAARSCEQVLDWNDGDIDWSGRGGDRGLRGIAFRDGHVYLAASDEVYVYDEHFVLKQVIGRNRYLKHCHEIDILGDTLWVTSAGHDCILAYDLRRNRYDVGYSLRHESLSRVSRRLREGLPEQLTTRVPAVRPTFRVFDPELPGGPEPRDTTHINSVAARDDGIYFAGRKLGHLYRVHDHQLGRYAIVPEGTHNAQPLWDDQVIMNDTIGDVVMRSDRQGRHRVRSAVPTYGPEELKFAALPEDTARQAFGRGLAIWRDHYAITGSSPATVAVHDLRAGEPVVQVNLSMDVRNAIHGLEVWPFVSR